MCKENGEPRSTARCKRFLRRLDSLIAEVAQTVGNSSCTFLCDQGIHVMNRSQRAFSSSWHRLRIDEDSPLCRTIDAIRHYRIYISIWLDWSRIWRRKMDPLRAYLPAVHGVRAAALPELTRWESRSVFHACPLPEKDHV